ncbi:MAG: HAD-IA family hydrolase [Methyloversatilis sp.]|uniref:HAD-IA family hydrolase n=1 Tax=Methyloversatilis sp. TaxID=2569862 RepID=UPI002734172D|nr:HAD-IA family hydrolase [Methyloversatilis sp.]MDP2869504.1 HAD-IA family hydrolase [Methyloversatilis sp.]MDP3577318.1 HAD-IA family hydrolase [Methyloversatilis sp.]
MPAIRPDALIFDVDGTLADTEEAHRTAFNLAFEQQGLGWNWSRADYRRLLTTTGGKERIARHIGALDLTDAERAGLLDRLPQIHAAKTRFYSAVVRDGAVPLRPGVARLLDEAGHAGCRLAIASTTTAINVDALLHATLGARALERFAVIACGDQVAAKKPAPDIYLLALEHLGVRADQAIAFEDSLNGLRAARAAGLWTVITPTFWTEDSDFSDADLVLPQLGDAASPLPDEPGTRLRHLAWLGFDELCRLAGGEAHPADAALR